MKVLSQMNPKAFEVGEAFVQESLDSGDREIVVNVLDDWITFHMVSQSFEKAEKQ